MKYKFLLAATLVFFLLALSLAIFTNFKKTKSFSFCEMNENERFEMCPDMRMTLKDEKDNSKLVIYKCDDRISYIETYKLTKKREESFKEVLESLKKEGVEINKVCSSEYGVVIKLVDKSKLDNDILI